MVHLIITNLFYSNTNQPDQGEMGQGNITCVKNWFWLMSYLTEIRVQNELKIDTIATILNLSIDEWMGIEAGLYTYASMATHKRFWKALEFHLSIKQREVEAAEQQLTIPFYKS